MGRKYYKNLKIAAVIVVAVPVIVAICWGLWNLQRWFHWTFAYSNDVKTEICQMVKPEYLKNPAVCND